MGNSQCKKKFCGCCGHKDDLSCQKDKLVSLQLDKDYNDKDG